MTTDKTKRPDARGHEHVLEIALPPAEVWKAITEAEELARWFPLAAETKPGAGGEIVYRWGELAGRCRILAWKPPHHLQTGWMEAPSGAGEASATARPTLVVDWFLEAKGGATVLRLVHSGFGRDAEFDKEYDGTKRGWDFELQGLKHYLERHRGQSRRAAWIRRATQLTPGAVWERFAKPGPLFRKIALDSLGAGDRYRFERADGEALEGRVLVNQAPLEFAGTLTSHGDGMLRFGFEDCVNGPEAHLWIATWGLGTQEFARLESSWEGALERTFAS